MCSPLSIENLVVYVELSEQFLFFSNFNMYVCVFVCGFVIALNRGRFR